jgi:hypothetical protein
MYLWSLLGTDLSAGPASSGITGDAASAMRMSEPEVANGNAFLCIIEEVRPRISVGGLETIYASTGRHWIGRRTRGRGVFWEAKRRTVDPAEVYRVDAPPRPSSRMCHDGTHATSDLHRAPAGG